MEGLQWIAVALLPKVFGRKCASGELFQRRERGSHDAAVRRIEDYNDALNCRRGCGVLRRIFLKKGASKGEFRVRTCFLGILRNGLCGENFHCLSLQGLPISGKRTIFFAHDAERRCFFCRSRSILRIKPRGDEFRQLEIVSADISARRPGDLHVNPLAFRADEFELDRKSTRLNSSHGYISYAVFCLKKKKTPETRRRLRSL